MSKQHERGTRWYTDLDGKVFSYIDATGENDDPAVDGAYFAKNMAPRDAYLLGKLNVGYDLDWNRDGGGWFSIKRVK